MSRRVEWDVMAVCLALAAAIAVFFFACGCGAGEDLRKAVKGGAEFATLAEPAIRAVRREQQQKCLELPSADAAEQCSQVVRAKWDPIIDAYDKARETWCSVDAALGKGKCP